MQAFFNVVESPLHMQNWQHTPSLDILQATVVELEAMQQQLKAQLADASDRHDAAQRAAAEASLAAAELLSKTQARTSCFAR